MSVAVIIPTIDAAGYLPRLLDALLAQTLVPDEILVVDSSSSDGTPDIARRFARVRVIGIARETFDHGGTRDMAVRRTDADFVVMMTQDALPVDEHSLERLLAPFEEEDVAAVGGRQIAYAHASAAEKLVRAHNYRAQSRVWRAQDIEAMGVRAFLIADVFAAYRRSAYLAVGGFEHPIMTNEDMLIAERLLRAGYALAYSGEAAVYHSHDFTLAQQFKRNMIVGRTLKRYEERFMHVQEMGDGIALVKDVMRELARERKPVECVRFAADCAARLAGNRVGRWLEGREEKHG